MTTLTVALFLLILLAVCYHWHRDHKRANVAEQRVAIQAKTIKFHKATIAATKRDNATLRKTEARAWSMWRKANEDRDWERLLRTVAEADAERHSTALRGLLTNLARQELLRPDEASAEVISIERAR